MTHQNQLQQPEIMTTPEVCELLNIGRSTLHRLRQRGEIVAYKFGRKIYFKRSQILDAITANRVEVESIESSQAA